MLTVTDTQPRFLGGTRKRIQNPTHGTCKPPCSPWSWSISPPMHRRSGPQSDLETDLGAALV